MTIFKTIRWQQRLFNLQKAINLLTRSVAQQHYNELERSGLIQQFEFSFELGWKTLKDFLENEGILADSPKDVIKKAFGAGFLKDFDTWADALDKRTLLSHTYDENAALFATALIKERYFPMLEQVVTVFNNKLPVKGSGLELKVLLILLGHFLKYPQITEVVLFGSRAMGNFKPESDIDLAIKGSLSQEQFIALKSALINDEKLSYTVDLIHLDNTPNADISNHIKQFGKRLYP